MFKTFRLLVLLAVISAFLACSDDNITKAGGDYDTPATLENRIERNNEFALKLYSKLKDSGGNMIISPHSISTCFGMAYAGARGNTEREIAEVLCFNYPPSGFHTVQKLLNTELCGRPYIDLRIVNGCWGRDGLPYEQAYLDTLSECYGADMEYLDFALDPEGARETINLWVASRTNGFITQLFPPGCLNDQTYLVLANTVFFIADWLHQFDPDLTRPWLFKRLDDSYVTVDCMFGEEAMPYFEGDNFRAMAMPYKGEDVSMVLILPDEGEFQAFEDAFSAEAVDTICNHLSGKQYITFTIPKFGFYSNFDLNETLQEMGVVDAFTPGTADFSGMDGTDDGVPWIDLVVHKAYITINEYGTMAFAGTGMGLTLGVHPSFDAIRPFIFAVVDNPTGTILFIGRVLDPAQG